MLAVEFLVPFLLCCTFAVAPVFTRGMQRGMLLLLIVLQTLTLSFRPEDYNSDTTNYAGYIALIQEAELLPALLLTKFEPLHLLTALVSPSFRGWLLVEWAVWLAFAVGLVRRAQRLETLAIVLGCALPLFSSSLRFSVGILAIGYLSLRWQGRRFQAVSVSTIGASAHASLAVAGAFITARLWLVLGAIAALTVVTAFDPNILERAGASEDNPAQATGLRSLVPLLLFIVYLSRTVWRKKGLRPILAQLGIAAALFAATNLMFPILNRWIIVALVLLATRYDRSLVSTSRSRTVQASMALLLYGVLVLPFLISLDAAVASGSW
jgi:hypothetical protein